INSTTINSTPPRINSTTINSTPPRINSTLVPQISSAATSTKIPILTSSTILKRISQDKQTVVNKKPQIVAEDVMFNIGTIKCIAKKMRMSLFEHCILSPSGIHCEFCAW
ncbi:17053_t:CDS:2, partial [Dentiscutata heterogama]